jgi:hypothetical protein
MTAIHVIDSEPALNRDVHALHSVHIRYPTFWFSPVKLSPFARDIENETIRWMTSLGLIKDKAKRAHVLAMEPRHYAGYTHPLASYEHALMYCKYITMWLLWDDEVVESATNVDELAPTLQALADGQAPLVTPYDAAFKHIGDEYESLGASGAWRRRFASKMLDWAEHAIREEKVRQDANACCFEDALNLRSFTVGIRPNTLPLERAVGIEISNSLTVDPDYEDLLDCAAKICCIVNDIASIPKDIRNGQVRSNLVLYYQHSKACTLREAIGALVGIHNASIPRFDRLCEKLVRKEDSWFQDRLSTFLAHLRYMDSGFGFWHQNCVRYQSLLAVEDGTAFKLAIGAAPGV